jgi:ribosomal protein S21
MVEVPVRNNNIEAAIRKLKRKMEDEGVMEEMQGRRFFMTKRQKRRQKERQAAHKREVGKAKDGQD